MLKEKILKEARTIRSRCFGVNQDLINRSNAPEFPITSLELLNRKSWGLRKGLNIIAGRTSHGKSCLGRQIAWDLAKNGIPTFIMSLEDDVDTIIESLFTNIKEVDNYDLLTGCFKYRKDYQDAWDEFIKEIPKELLITNNIGSTFDEVNYMLEVLEPKPKCVVVDYIQAIKYEGKNERENLNEYIRRFREICIKNGIAGILMAQMNRMAVLGESKEPLLENLKGTGVLEEHADLVLLLQWEYFYNRDESKKNDFMIYVAKNKRGRTGKHPVQFFPQFSKFKECPIIQKDNYENEQRGII